MKEKKRMKEQKNIKEKKDIKVKVKGILSERSMRGKFCRLGVCMVVGAALGCIIGPVAAATQDFRVLTQDIQKNESLGDNIKIPESGMEDTDSAESLEAMESEAPEVKHVSLLAVGDDLIHTGLFKSGMKMDGTYNYDHLYANVKADILQADLAIVNQETIFTNNRSDYSGYPVFAGPVEIGDALADAGFDIVTHATNHVFDRGTQGIADTLDFWKTKHPEICVLGIHESQADADTIKTVEANGVTFGLLNYTYGMNGFVLPDDQPYLVDILDKDKVAADIKKAKAVSDCVIFFLHCGVEYTYNPSDETKDWVQFLLEQGVDITIASHPHVLEPYAMLTGEDGHQMLVYYSMGNFISTQDEYERLIGGMAKIELSVTGSGDDAEITVDSYGMEPLYTHYNHNTGVYTVYKFSDYTDALAIGHGLYGKNGVLLTREWIWNEFNKIMSTEIVQPGAVSVEQPWLETEHPLPQ